jgi:hypothetical protein
MSQSGFTPIQLYRTSTAAAVPTAGNLADGELAINLTDEALYFKNAAGVVKLLADSSGALGTVTSVDVSGGTTGLTTSGGPITSSGTITLAGTLGVANGGTGTATAFTAGSVVFAGASGVYTQDNANLFWDNTNDRLGIGTASPGERLTVAATANSAARITSTATTTALIIDNTNANAWGSNLAIRTGGVAAGYFGTIGSLLGSTSQDITAYADTGNGFRVYTNGNNERMRVTSAGNVGIGTNAPSDLLHVAGGNMRVSGATPVIAVWNAAGSDRYGYIFGQSGSMTFAAEGASRPMLFSVNGSERMRITSAGDVGIGTTAPDANLSVVGTDATSVFKVIAPSARVRFRPYVDATAGSMIEATNTAESAYSPLTLTGSVVRVTTNTGALTIFDASGNVGIGTSSPSAKLNVVNTGTNSRIAIGDTAAGTYSTMLMYGGSGKFNFQLGVQNNINDAFEITPSTAAGGTTFSTPAFVINSSANVGIGAAPTGYSNAQSSLQVKGFNTSNAGHISAITSAADGWLSLFSGTTAADNPAITWQSGGALRFAVTTNPAVAGFSERMRIDTSGNLLVGTTSNPESSRAVFSGSSQATMTCITDTTSTSNQIIFRNPNGAVGAIFTSGTATTYSTSSDYRLKKIDGPVANSGAYIDALKPVQGSWKADGSRFIGLLAHEVQEVSETTIATGEKDGEKMQAMDYSAPELIANLIAEIQSLRARVAELEGN